jgi:hypothetical protein
MRRRGAPFLVVFAALILVGIGVLIGVSLRTSNAPTTAGVANQSFSSASLVGSHGMQLSTSANSASITCSPVTASRRHVEVKKLEAGNGATAACASGGADMVADLHAMGASQAAIHQMTSAVATQPSEHR